MTILAVGAGLLPWAGAGSAVADSAGLPSVTLKGELGPQTKPAVPISADGSGVLSYGVDSGERVTWERPDGTYVNGLPKPLRLGEMWGVNGGFGLEQVGTTRTYRIRNYDTGKAVQFDLPASDKATTVFTGNRLMTLRNTHGKWSLHLLEIPAAGGAPVDHLVPGVPDTLPGTVTNALVDSRGAAIDFGGPAGFHALLDFATARLTVVPEEGDSATQVVSLSATRILYASYTDFDRYLVDRDHPDAPPTLLKVDSTVNLRLLGDWAVYPGADGQILAQPAAGGAARTLLPQSDFQPVMGADGAVYVAGGSGPDDWAVRRISIGADGTPAVGVLVPLPRQSVYDVGGIAVDQGQLRVGTLHVPSGVSRATTYLSGSSLSLTAGGTLNATPPQNVGDLGWHPADGEPAYDMQCTGECLRLVGTGEGDVVRSTGERWVPTLSASGTYSIQRPDARFQYVLDGTRALSHTDHWHAASLWGNQLWSAGSRSGTVSAVSLPSMKALGSAVSVGAPCTPEEIQVVGRWIYWSCGPTGRAGVYDRTTKHVITVPSGYAELADGYLVSQNAAAARLDITYFPGAVPAERVGTTALGPLKDQVGAAADRRGRFWAVDRFGGPVAYLTDAGDVTVRWPRVATFPLAVISTDSPAGVDLRADGSQYTGVWHLSKPAASWKLTIAADSGKTVRTLTGGPATGRISATWDGTGTDGRKVPTGTYRWTLTARAADHAGQSATAAGSLAVWSSVARRHDFGKDGVGDIVTMDTAGRLAIQPGDGRGGIDSAHKALAGGWPRGSYPVPFGDMNGDGCDDLLIRDSAGALTRYDGSCGSPIAPKSAHVRLGTGFNAYNVLTSPGDLTGDGRADLLARDAAGVLWTFPGTTTGGLGTRVKGAPHQQIYQRLVGAGDLDGDGIGDVIAQDKAGVLWRLLGTGKSGFHPRIGLSSGFASYNVLAVPGDLTGDGRPDLVARDTAGRLWRLNGTSAGSFSARTRIATNWQSYLYLT
ncbi:FG-GAP-like repeat-containing protein [Streptomyces xylophagus]|uniref:FG-GAP-like repeat-containing protein n=1 Tax=Streptomyces xylophagus TaxID=285514 RepID=UPI000690D179|nr:FG-GAP-like repeat-containing protein [Streptomyces xylophagus]